MMTTQNKAGDFYGQQLNMADVKGENPEELILKQAVLRISGHILGFVMGIIGALIIFVATNWLVLKGGEEVGPHLGLLGQFFYGYEVTFPGSFIGAAYGFVTGYISGLVIGWVYNAVVFIRNLSSENK
jgi:hypothetical protein